MKTQRLSRDGWLELGFTALRKEGVSALTIDKLCESANKTKGSFYYHFNTIDNYVEELIEHWQEIYTQKIIDAPQAKFQRLDLLNRLVSQFDPELETGMRALAARSRKLQILVSKSDEKRISWLAGLYTATGNYNNHQAETLATIEIAAFTGLRVMKPDMKPQEARLFYENFMELTNRT